MLKKYHDEYARKGLNLDLELGGVYLQRVCGKKLVFNQTINI